MADDEAPRRTHPRIDWGKQPLGKVADAELAARLGCKPSRVAAARAKRKIRAHGRRPPAGAEAVDNSSALDMLDALEAWGLDDERRILVIVQGGGSTLCTDATGPLALAMAEALRPHLRALALEDLAAERRRLDELEAKIGAVS